MIGLRVILVVTVVALMVPVSQALQTNLPWPEFGPCNKQLLDVAKRFWALRGQPKNILRTMDRHNYLVVYTTFDELTNIKCVQINATAQTSTLNAFFYQTDGSRCRPEVLSYSNVVEDGGVLILEGGKTLINILTIDDNSISYYVCSPNSTSSKPPLVSVLVNTKYVDNPLTQYASKLMTSFLTSLLGKDVAAFFNNGCKCILGY